MTATTTEALGRCSWATCLAAGTGRSPQGWTFCDEHLAKDAALSTEQDKVLARPAGTPLPRATTPATATVEATPVSAIDTLLQQAADHRDAGIRRLGDQIRAKVDALTERLDRIGQQEKERQREAKRKAAEKAKARAEVERLQAELKQAQARLRGTGATGTSRAAAWTPERRAAASKRARATAAAKAALKQAQT